ncbi:MAG TPA: hypothetical protein PK530_01040 [Anaerolineales bacterium]|nr:hypothetical protein [Anaerolineales bacterium]
MRESPIDQSLKTATGAIFAARLFSNIASPPALFSAFAFLMAWVDRPSLIGLSWAALYGFLAHLLPVLYLVYLYKAGKVYDIHVSSPAERRIPYRVGLVGAFVSFLIIRLWADMPLLANLILIHVLIMLVLALANELWLISAHVAAITALTIQTGVVFGTVFSLIMLPLIPLPFFIRRYLKRHTLGELISGLFVGVGSVLVLAALNT